MASGAQAAQMMVAKAAAKEPCGPNTCVQGLREEIFGPLGVSVPASNLVSDFLVPPLTKIDAPFVGCIARFPQALGYEHVCMITDISGNTTQETSFGTAVGYVRSATFPTEFYESFWDPHYSGVAGVEPAGMVTSASSDFLSLSSVGTVLNTLSSKEFWLRSGLFVLGVILLLIVLFKMFADSDTGQAIISKTETVAKTAAEAAAFA